MFIRVGKTRVNLAQVTHIEETEDYPIGMLLEEARREGMTFPVLRLYFNFITDGIQNYVQFQGEEIDEFEKRFGIAMRAA